ncbi:MAG: sugar phosphate isomerase/epimerase [Thermoguttaceae bacterium]|nr:sugar phosphate isomerase/epimerase [Thermoguttaceae bacterium]MDW8039558.1 sugar phosphate isomerase/epimerase [Thermoguttaceae bacterium]
MNLAQFHLSRLTRREFMAGAAAGMACMVGPKLALGAVKTASETSAGRWRMKLSTSSIHFMSLPIEKACERIAALGFEAIDIWSAYAGCAHLDEVQNRLGPGGLQELLAKHRLKLYSFSVYVGGYRKYAELLGRAGGGVAVRGSTGPCDPKELTPRMKAFLDSLQPEAELAEKYNSYIAIENHGHALLDSIDSIKAFVELNRNPRIGIALAPYHVQARGEKVEEAILAAGKQLLFFYAWQQAPGLEQLPGIGPADFTPWIAALAKVDYRWYVNPFMHGEPPPERMSQALAKTRDYLQAIYAKAVPEPSL